QRNLLVSERADFLSTSDNVTEKNIVFAERHEKPRAHAAQLYSRPRHRVVVPRPSKLSHIIDVDQRFAPHQSRHIGTGGADLLAQKLCSSRWQIARRLQVEGFAIISQQRTKWCVTQTVRLLQDSVEHRGKIAR